MKTINKKTTSCLRAKDGKDCNIERLLEIGQIATGIAIQDYEAGDLAPDPFEQIGRVLFLMQKESQEKTVEHGKNKRLPKKVKTTVSKRAH